METKSTHNEGSQSTSSTGSAKWRVSVMTREGKWYAWTKAGWENNCPAQLLEQMDAVSKARYAMNEVPWVFGVKLEEREPSISPNKKLSQP